MLPVPIQTSTGGIGIGRIGIVTSLFPTLFEIIFWFIIILKEHFAKKETLFDKV